MWVDFCGAIPCLTAFGRLWEGNRAIKLSCKIGGCVICELEGAQAGGAVGENRRPVCEITRRLKNEEPVRAAEHLQVQGAVSGDAERPELDRLAKGICEV